MKKTYKISFIYVLLLSLAFLNAHSVLAEELDITEYAWVWITDRDYYDPETDRMHAEYEKKYKEHDVKYSFNAGSQGSEYFVDYYANKVRDKKSSAMTATVGLPPKEISPEKPVQLNLRLAVTENTLGDAGGGVSVRLCDPTTYLVPQIGGKPYYDNQFKSDSGKAFFSVNEVEGYGPYDTIISNQPPAGAKPYDTMAICTDVSLLGYNMGIRSYYQWLPAGYQRDMSFLNEKYEVQKDENGDYYDSGARVSDIAGEVYIRHGDGDKLSWELLEPGMVIYDGDVIHTKGRDARVVLSLDDMTTFNLGPNAGIIMDTRSEKESKLKLLHGKVMANVKKMFKDGTMNVEMSQAVAGIKGTIFVAESDGDVSRLQVLEGTVEVTDKNGKKVTLTQNQEVVSVKDKGLQEVETVNTDETLTYWDDTVVYTIKNEIAERTSEGKLEEAKSQTKTKEKEDNFVDSNHERKMPILSILGIILVVGIAGMLYWWKRK